VPPSAPGLAAGHRGSPAVLRHALGGLLALTALNAIGGGGYGVAGAPGFPREWLEGTSFGSYFVPGVILFLVVGGSSLVAAVAVFARRRRARAAALAAGAILLGWLAVQVAVIGYRSWLQPAMAIVALAIGALALALPAP
jgi:hypothetical protein